MCGGAMVAMVAMVPWCHQVHAAPYGLPAFGRHGRFHCGDPWVDEDGREWLTLEICHVLSIQQHSAAFSSIQQHSAAFSSIQQRSAFFEHRNIMKHTLHRSVHRIRMLRR